MPHIIDCPPLNDMTITGDVLCQVITLPNHPTGQAISWLMTHRVWGLHD